MPQKRTLRIVGCVLLIVTSATCRDARTLSEVIEQLEASGEIPTLDTSDSVAGPDLNGNGVRDDLDRHIDSLPDTAEQKSALRQLSFSLNQAMTLGATAPSEAVASTANRIDRGVHCLWQQYGREAADKSEDMRNFSVNTLVRLKAYEQFNEKLDGTVARLPKGNTCETF